MIETLYNLIQHHNADISMCSFCYIGKDNVKQNSYTHSVEVTDKITAIKELLCDKKIRNFAWDKLYKRELFSDVRFPEGKNFEDIGTTIYLFDKINTLVRVDTPKYFYLRREDSISNTRNEKNISDFIYLLMSKYKFVSEKYKEAEAENDYNFIISMIFIYTSIKSNNLYLSELWDKCYKQLKCIVMKNNYNTMNMLSSEQKEKLDAIMNLD